MEMRVARRPGARLPALAARKTGLNSAFWFTTMRRDE
jgi:hypothetical protein